MQLPQEVCPMQSNGMQAYKELGADLLFIEAIKSKEDMKTVIKEVPGYHMINLIEGWRNTIVSY